MSGKSKTHHVVVAAMLSAVAFILQFLEFSIPIMPVFIKLDLSDLPALLGTFALGPGYGVAIELVKNLLHLPFGTSAGVGELSNFLLGAVFVFVAGIVYRRRKNRRTALWGSILGAVSMAAVSLPLNYYLVYPAYVAVYGMPLQAIIEAYREILGHYPALPGAHSDVLMACLVMFNVPFTFFKGLLNVALCFLIYKPLSPLLHK